MSATASYSPAYAAIVVDAKTGAVLHEAAPDGRRHPASLTKIMTLYLLFERLEAGKIALDTEMPVSEEAAAQAPTKLGVRAGQTLKVADAIGGLVTKSANDAAVVVAEALSGAAKALDGRDSAEAMIGQSWKSLQRAADKIGDDPEEGLALLKEREPLIDLDVERQRWELAKELSIPTVVVPPRPGAGSRTRQYPSRSSAFGRRCQSLSTFTKSST